jgi:hypothetical protein
VSRFGETNVFRDVDVIKPGDNFAQKIAESIGSVDALVAIIGPEWSSAVGGAGTRRLDDPQDWVRIELVAALEKDVLVIPVLVGGARMPRDEQLPEPLKPLASIQALEISESRWRFDTGVLEDRLDEYFTRPERPTVRRHRARLVGALGVTGVLACLLWLFWPDDTDVLSTVVEPGRTECSALECAESISFSLSALESDASIEVKLTQPDNTDLPPEQITVRPDGTAEWRWTPSLSDPIGTYRVDFVKAGTTFASHDLTVHPVTGSFGVVQILADAIIANNWERAVSLDVRLKEFYDAAQASGQDPVAEVSRGYQPYTVRRYMPADIEGVRITGGRLLTGGFYGYRRDDDQTVIHCEYWLVYDNLATMRSEPLMVDGEQITTTTEGRMALVDAAAWSEKNCVSPPTVPTLDLPPPNPTPDPT